MGDGTWLDDDEPSEKGFVVRPARPHEILAIFGAGMEHMAATVDGELVGIVSMKRMDGRLWAMLSIAAKPDSLWRQTAVVSAMRRNLRKHNEPVWAVQEGPLA